MTKEELMRALKLYGDHKGYCGITNVLRDHRAKTDVDGNRQYPICTCGWTELSHALTLLLNPD